VVVALIRDCGPPLTFDWLPVRPRRCHDRELSVDPVKSLVCPTSALKPACSLSAAPTRASCVERGAMRMMLCAAWVCKPEIVNRFDVILGALR